MAKNYNNKYISAVKHETLTNKGKIDNLEPLWSHYTSLLDNRGGGLSRRMNRLLARTYRKVIKDKLTRLKEKFGITTVEVNAAYTSQECSKCGFVSKGNRKSQSKFSCTCCGHKVNADVNAARNIIKSRSFDIKLRAYACEHKVRITRCLILERLLHKHKSSCSNNLASCHL